MPFGRKNARKLDGYWSCKPDLLGGVFSEYVSWRWIFFVNVPLCLLAGAVIAWRFDEKVTRAAKPIDYRGSALLTTGLTLVILGVLEGGPLWVFRRRPLVTSWLASFGVGAVLLGLTSYVPTYVQDVLGTGPLVAGLALATLLLGWSISGSQAGQVYLRIGFRGCALIGTAILLVGAALMLLLGRHSSVFEVAGFCLVIGLGIGLTATPTLVAARFSVGRSQRGVVTANDILLRSLGSALAVAVFGAIANAMIGSSDQVDPGRLTQAMHHIFIALVVIAVVMALAVSLMARGDTPVDEPAPAAPAES